MVTVEQLEDGKEFSAVLTLLTPYTVLRLLLYIVQLQECRPRPRTQTGNGPGLSALWRTGIGQIACTGVLSPSTHEFVAHVPSPSL
jgi:hypothetical protein